MLAKSLPVRVCAVLITGLCLSACGTAQGDRTVSGGLIGAGTGAVLGSIAGNAGTGALIGGLGGAAIGALTSPYVLDLGRPLWRQASLHSECVRWSPSTGRCVRSARQQPRNLAQADPASADWIASCSRRCRSFDPASGTYLGYDGYRHDCR